jgi:hypothetical protein
VDFLAQDRRMPDSSPSSADRRVVTFRRNHGRRPTLRPSLQQSPPVDDLRQFEHADEPDDYRHRMLTNVAAAAFTLLLMAAGLWLAESLSAMRKDQDCVLSGRRGCTPVEAPVQPRGALSSPQSR